MSNSLDVERYEVNSTEESREVDEIKLLFLLYRNSGYLALTEHSKNLIKNELKARIDELRKKKPELIPEIQPELDKTNNCLIDLHDLVGTDEEIDLDYLNSALELLNHLEQERTISRSTIFRNMMHHQNKGNPNQDKPILDLDEDFYSELDYLVFLSNNAKEIRTY